MIQASVWPSPSARKVTSRPSREMAAACAVSDKSVSCVTFASASGSRQKRSCAAASQYAAKAAASRAPPIATGSHERPPVEARPCEAGGGEGVPDLGAIPGCEAVPSCGVEPGCGPLSDCEAAPACASSALSPRWGTSWELTASPVAGPALVPSLDASSLCAVATRRPANQVSSSEQKA